ncbi:DUF2017 family protein [Amycolatopsis cihanbeyliensis]|uniref:Uncharacterized protein n=1 Tax=Amycolatopsis cihanbeyliensis TaxID=1128664 RepID=A0A542DL64_AMYCI|nr:DUF2017 family protein [Amycolatopsis cihanbeyliensis]TQJ03842.1 hypothetical protein FB471_3611 [Amycolatopsis cihanbeyliensis]
MHEHAVYDLPADYFDALPAADGVLVRMSENVADTLAHHAEQLIVFLERGEVPPGGSGLLRRGPTPESVGRRMFPDAYRNRAEAAAFRERHAAALRDTGAAHRVFARCCAGPMHTLPHAEVDDWLVTFGLARFVFLPRKGADPGMAGTWLTHVQETLILATNPNLVLPPTPSTHRLWR